MLATILHRGGLKPLNSKYHFQVECLLRTTLPLLSFY
jgi:hypothetical protein